MANIPLDLTQSDEVEILLPQGVMSNIGIRWFQTGQIPSDMASYTVLAQLRTDYIENDGALVKQFNLAADIDGNFQAFNATTATSSFVFSDVLTRSMIRDKYFFEAKLFNPSGKAVKSVKIFVKTDKKEIARV